MSLDLGVNIMGPLGFRKKLVPLVDWFLCQMGIKEKSPSLAYSQASDGTLY
jgi:hypothetical protein